MSPNHLASPDLFAVVGDARRRQIIELLAAGERSVGSLSTELGISQPSVTQHLAALRAVGVVTSEKRGTSSIYRLVPDPLAELGEWVASVTRR